MVILMSEIYQVCLQEEKGSEHTVALIVWGMLESAGIKALQTCRA